ncbi:hypothetical protein ES707_13910 [subsurface metagenome]|jgi:hypothetical protein
MLRRTMMASAIAALTAPVTAAASYPRAFLRKGRQRFTATARLMVQC